MQRSVLGDKQLMEQLPLINDITALGLLSMVFILGYYFLGKVFKILTNHLEKMVRRQDTMIALLRECLRQNPDIKDSLQNLDHD